jgi:hypothetical protein
MRRLSSGVEAANHARAAARLQMALRRGSLTARKTQTQRV